MHSNGHWGGVHAVYNLYNCTRLVEFREWIQQRGLTVVWQTLFQPDYLDPMKHDHRVRDLARKEAELLMESCGSYMQDAEKDFFRGVIEASSSNDLSSIDIPTKFRKHIKDIETLYHPDQLDKFSELWPELAFLTDAKDLL
jgi:hypothetical protein